MKVIDLFNQMVNKVSLTSLNGRKFRLFLIGLGVGFLGFGLICLCPELAPQFGTLLTFITGMYATFCGSNVASSYVAAKNPASSIPEGGSDNGI